MQRRRSAQAATSHSPICPARDKLRACVPAFRLPQLLRTFCRPTPGLRTHSHANATQHCSSGPCWTRWHGMRRVRGFSISAAGRDTRLRLGWRTGGFASPAWTALPRCCGIFGRTFPEQMPFTATCGGSDCAGDSMRFWHGTVFSISTIAIRRACFRSLPPMQPPERCWSSHRVQAEARPLAPWGAARCITPATRHSPIAGCCRPRGSAF